MSTPESTARWFRVLLLVAWAAVLLALLWSIGVAVRASNGRPGFVVLALTSAACAWLLVVIRQLPGWRS